MSKNCPRCALINPDSTVRCDCGYDFAEGVTKQSYVLSAASQKDASRLQQLVQTHGSAEGAFRELGKRKMFRGLAWLAGASILTALSHSAVLPESERTGEGMYFIFTGAFFIGGLQFLTGLIQYIFGKR